MNDLGSYRVEKNGLPRLWTVYRATVVFYGRTFKCKQTRKDEGLALSEARQMLNVLQHRQTITHEWLDEVGWRAE